MLNSRRSFARRDTNYRTKASLPAKETLEEAKTNTDLTKRKRIQVAFDCRMMPNYIEGNQPHDLSQVVDDEEVGRMSVQRIILNEEKTSYHRRCYYMSHG
jgi:hypothetical protein